VYNYVYKEVYKCVQISFLKTVRRRNLLDLAGKIEFAEGYDYKSLRAGKKQ